MQQTPQSGTSWPSSAEIQLCETCLERGRRCAGTHPVGTGFLCDPCFKGEGTPSERADEYRLPGEHKARRSYRQRNLKKFREYQRRYRARQGLNGLASKQ